MGTRQRFLLWIETGYCIHALNTVYIASIDKWIRLDARGNKEGIDAEFSIEDEKLAFHIILWTLVCFRAWSFSLIRKMECSETINHPLCGCASNVIQKNYLSVYNRVVQAIL